jgi:hypothetical protein
MPKRTVAKRKSISKSRKTVGSSLFSRSKVRLALLLGCVVLIIGGWMSLSKMMQPAGVNEIAEGGAGWQKFPAGVKVDSNGCYYKQIQCVTEPCNPVPVCPAGVTPAPTNSPTKEGMFCTQEAGTCVNTVGQCVGYTDGCQKSKLCGSNPRQCGKVVPSPVATCIPLPSCAPGQACPRRTDTNYCPIKPTLTPTPKPSQTPVPTPSCSCPPGAMCKLDARCGQPSSTPTSSVAPTPSAIDGIGNFSAMKACGSDSYLYISFSCQRDKKLYILTDGACMDVYTGLKKATSVCSLNVTSTTTNSGAK